ncbi:MAG TPA: hypothetical protein DD459_01015 [Halieaceae bacterium]|nr:hypothetical protein [Halieaceae bacterium]
MTGQIEQRLEQLGLVLPAQLQLPAGLSLPFSWARVIGNRVVLSGHLPTNEDGSLWLVTGKVGSDVNIDQAYQAARQATLAMLGTLQRELGSLDRITHWVKVLGMVNVAPGFHQTAPVMNGCSELLIEVFGSDTGNHTRSAVGFAEIPFGCPVEVEAEVMIDGD